MSLYKLESATLVGDKQAFAQKVKDTAKALLMDPDHLMAVMHFESRLNPQAKNPNSTATGLIQFMANTAVSLGTTTDALYRMDALAQMDYVYKYLRPHRGKMNSLLEAYLAVFYPVAMGKPLSYKFPAQVTKYNPVFDIDKDGYITKAEIDQKLKEHFPDLKKKG